MIEDRMRSIRLSAVGAVLVLCACNGQPLAGTPGSVSVDDPPQAAPIAPSGDVRIEVIAR